MGVKLLILLALLIGVLYCIHLLVRDYQAVFGGRPRLLRLLMKRDVTADVYSKPNVRWKKILQHDPIECARYLYCDIGAHPQDSDVRQGFAYMLTLETREEDKSAWERFKEAYDGGRAAGVEQCKRMYGACPFRASLLMELIQYLLRHN